MSDLSASRSGGGIGLASALGIVFIVLKLCGVIGWHWAWVLAPFWMPLALVLAVLLVVGLGVGVVALIVALAESRSERKQRKAQPPPFRKPWMPAGR